MLAVSALHSNQIDACYVESLGRYSGPLLLKEGLVINLLRCYKGFQMFLPTPQVLQGLGLKHIKVVIDRFLTCLK